MPFDSVVSVTALDGLTRGSAMVIGDARNPTTPEVYQPSACSTTFYVYWASGAYKFVSTPFQFIAVGTTGR